MLAETNPDCSKMLLTSRRLEEMVVAELDENKKIFQNVDLYSGIIYHAQECLRIFIRCSLLLAGSLVGPRR
jgi:citrate synthase